MRISIEQFAKICMYELVMVELRLQVVHTDGVYTKTLQEDCVSEAGITIAQGVLSGRNA